MTTIFLRTLAIGTLAFIVFATVSPIGLRPSDILPVDIDRALAFVLLGMLFVLAFPKHWLYAAIFVLLGSFTIEALQHLVPTRHPRIGDASIKAVGAAAGIALGYMLNRIRLSYTNRVLR
tara:strand:+ start:131 stop:490 length:360 start_codon:yes stop_codon:yes gene_type:complete